MDSATLQAVERLIATQAIRDALVRYCRGVDRICVETVKSAYWPDAYDEHGSFSGNAWDYAEHLETSLRHFLRTTHTIGNVHIEFDGEEARVESQVLAYHEADVAGEVGRVMLGARYVDRFQRRGGEWRILRRICIRDWTVGDGPGGAIMEGMKAALRLEGAPYPEDPWCKGAPEAFLPA